MNARLLFTRLFWMDAIERVIATFAEVLGGFLVVDATNVKVSWTMAFTVALVAAFATLLKSVAAAAKADTDTASFTVNTLHK